MPTPVIARRYYPTLSTIVSQDDIPEILGFLKDGIEISDILFSYSHLPDFVKKYHITGSVQYTPNPPDLDLCAYLTRKEINDFLDYTEGLVLANERLMTKAAYSNALEKIAYARDHRCISADIIFRKEGEDIISLYDDLNRMTHKPTLTENEITFNIYENDPDRILKPEIIINLN